MKTLANCTDVEFLRQTNRIRKYAEDWLKVTGVLEIRKRKLTEPDEGLSEEEKREWYRKNARARLNDMLDAALETHAEQTAGLLRLMCFVEPDDDQSLRVPQMLGAVSELMENQDVLDFFTSLGRLGLMNT